MPFGGLSLVLLGFIDTSKLAIIEYNDALIIVVAKRIPEIQFGKCYVNIVELRVQYWNVYLSSCVVHYQMA